MISSIGSSSAAATSQVGGSSFAKKLFARLDGDQDGKVTLDEFKTALDEKLAKHAAAAGTEAPDTAEVFKQFDQDSDGQINESEFVGALKQLRRPPPPPPPRGEAGGDRPAPKDLFKEIDADGDGSVTVDELKADFEKRAAERPARDGDTGPDFSKLLEKLDTDGNGSLSEAEFTKLVQQHQGPPPPPPFAFGEAYGSNGASSSGSGAHGSRGTFSAQA